jgi:hypothetical protein
METGVQVEAEESKTTEGNESAQVEGKNDGKN